MLRRSSTSGRLCYFNALRELGGARRIVEDEVRAKLAAYGTERRRIAPLDQPFANRRLRDVLELTSRENTDKVAAAKEALRNPVRIGELVPVDRPMPTRAAHNFA